MHCPPADSSAAGFFVVEAGVGDGARDVRAVVARTPSTVTVSMPSSTNVLPNGPYLLFAVAFYVDSHERLRGFVDRIIREQFPLNRIANFLVRLLLTKLPMACHRCLQQ